MLLLLEILKVRCFTLFDFNDFSIKMSSVICKLFVGKIKRMIVFTTERLKIKIAELKESHIELLLEIWNNPDVMKNVGFPKVICPAKSLHLTKHIFATSGYYFSPQIL